MVESENQQSPTEKLPPSFFKPLDELSFMPDLFSNSARRRTETFSSFGTGFPLEGAQSANVNRIRASSLSIPHHSFAKAFGPSLFSSDWTDTPEKLESPEPIVTQGNDVDNFVLEQTLDYLGLDDPPARKSLFEAPTSTKEEQRPRSISFSYALSNTTIDKSELFGNLAIQIPRNKNSDVPTTPLPVTAPAANHKGFMNSAFSPTPVSAFPATVIAPPVFSPGTPSIPANLGSENEHHDPSQNPEENLDEDHDSPSDHVLPSRSLWIGNIDSTLGQEELFTIFSPFGAIESIRMLQDKECAFVNYANVEDAIRAREEMQGGRVGNCIVRIGYGKTEGIHESQGMQPTKSLWVGNILPSTKPSDLEAIFSPFGQVESARVLTHKNCGFVNFVQLEDAITARAELNGQEISGSVVKIGFAKVPTKQESIHTIPASSESPYFNAPTTPESPWRTMGNSPNRPPSNGSRQASYKSFASEIPVPIENPLIDDIYATAIPPVPEPNTNRKTDQNRLRDIRKKLEGHCAPRDVDMIFNEIIDDAADLCSDYIGNVVIQKVAEKCNDIQRLKLIDVVGEHLAALGIHKNGTWAVQKLIECARSPNQMDAVVGYLTKYTPPLLLDQFGNYVVQCCLRMKEKNQFVFDAICAKVWELGQGRFGARAIRTCLESQYTTKRQQKDVSNAILHYCVQLSMNPNGNILVTWLLELSSLPGRYRALSQKMGPHVAILCCHKLASITILKLVSQRLELDGREMIISEIFKEPALSNILADQTHGVGLVMKILSTGCISQEERIRLAEKVRPLVQGRSELGYKRLIDELQSIPTTNDEVVSPLIANSGFFAPSQEATPVNSPQALKTVRQVRRI